MRDPARTEHAARKRYIRILQRSLGCITRAQWYFRTESEGDSLLLISGAPLELRRQGNLPKLYLEAEQRFRIIPDPREEFSGEYKSTTLAYIYSVQSEPSDTQEPEIVGWHWHPATTPGRVRPHIHVRVDHPKLGQPLSDSHIPTARVSFEDVVTFLIEDWGVKEARDDWRDVIAESRSRFETFRMWS